MTEHDLSAGGDVMERVRGCARGALAAYGGHPAASVELLNVSENATFLVTDPDAGPSVLRVHRLRYHTEPEIATEPGGSAAEPALSAAHFAVLVDVTARMDMHAIERHGALPFSPTPRQVTPT